MNGRRHDMDTEQIDEIEGQLAGTLRPVRPPNEFVQRLRSRIRMPDRDEIVVRLQDWERLIMVFGGVLSGALVILTVSRAMYHLFGRRNG